MKFTRSISLFFALILIGCQSVLPPTPTPTEFIPTATAPPPTATADPNSWNLVWADEFEQPDGSAPDPTKWNHQRGGAGWGNGELQFYTDAITNSFIEEGMLVISANEEYMLGRDYTSARLSTQFKAGWTYGRYEIRAKLPNTQGIWPAFWLLPTSSHYGSGTAGGEIDIMELIGSEPGRAYGTLHMGTQLGIPPITLICPREPPFPMISISSRWNGNLTRFAGTLTTRSTIPKPNGLLRVEKIAGIPHRSTRISI